MNADAEVISPAENNETAEVKVDASLVSTRLQNLVRISRFIREHTVSWCELHTVEPNSKIPRMLWIYLNACPMQNDILYFVKSVLGKICVWIKFSVTVQPFLLAPWQFLNNFWERVMHASILYIFRSCYLSVTTVKTSALVMTSYLPNCITFFITRLRST